LRVCPGSMAAVHASNTVASSSNAEAEPLLLIP
jgi:hypothetical protein